MSLKHYKLNTQYLDLPIGTQVTDQKFTDYGLASDDSRRTGIEHTTVTLDPDGDYPGFTIPKGYLDPFDPEAPA